MGLCGQHPRTEGNLHGTLRYVGDFLRNDEINLAIHAVLHKTAPFRGIFHIWSGGPVIYIEIDQFPFGAETYRIGKLLLVIGQVVVVLGLIEVPDIYADLERVACTGTFVANTLQPSLMCCDLFCLFFIASEQVPILGNHCDLVELLEHFQFFHWKFLRFVKG